MRASLHAASTTALSVHFALNPPFWPASSVVGMLTSPFLACRRRAQYRTSPLLRALLLLLPQALPVSQPHSRFVCINARPSHLATGWCRASSESYMLNAGYM